MPALKQLKALAATTPEAEAAEAEAFELAAAVEAILSAAEEEEATAVAAEAQATAKAALEQKAWRRRLRPWTWPGPRRWRLPPRQQLRRLCRRGVR